MPVRFQVDPDFYDHPKVTGMSDTAFALWVRAGSYSAAKLTDGFISEDVLAHTLRYDTPVADELVQRRLWRRTRGGYRFHQWDGRNLVRERVEADRKADRDRKRTARNATPESPVDNSKQKDRQADQSANPQGNNSFVRPDTGRNPSGLQEDSEGIPAVSVSVSSSVSSSGSSRGERPVGRRAPEQRPPDRCPRHANDPDPPPCGPCGDARRAVERWDAGQHQDVKAAVRACTLCDADGWRYLDPARRAHGLRSGPGARCDHTRQPVPT